MKLITDIFQDNNNAWCGARFLVMGSGAMLMIKFGMGTIAASDLYAGIPALAAAYALKDWSERR